MMGTSHSTSRNRNIFGRKRESERQVLPGNWEGRHTRGEAKRKRYWTNQARRLRVRNQKSKLRQELKETSRFKTSSTGSGSATEPCEY